MNFDTGQTVGEYCILEPLGSGGSGHVYRVEHPITKRQEAMKVLADGKAETEEQRERFLREVRVQASLNHTNITALHNAFYIGAELVMVMELVEGESLRSLLKKGRLPLGEGIKYLVQLLTALSYAHEHGVVHRDISPSNLLVTPDGTLKVTDFGLAKTAKMHVTPEGVILGSLHYMSPEQVRGLEMLDARSDVYSCGAVAYEVVSGRTPFQAQSPFELMLAHVERVPQPPLGGGSPLFQQLDAVILRALAKDPLSRFASTDEFRIALEAAWRQQTPLHPARMPLVVPARLKSAAALALAATTVFGLVTAALWLGTARQVSSDPPQLTPASSASATILPEPDPHLMPPEVPMMGQRQVVTPPKRPAAVRKRPELRVETTALPPQILKPKIHGLPPQDDPPIHSDAPAPSARPTATTDPGTVMRETPPAAPPAPTVVAEDHPAAEPEPEAETGKRPGVLRRAVGKLKGLNPFKQKEEPGEQ